MEPEKHKESIGVLNAQQRRMNTLWDTPVSKITNGLTYNSRVTPERPIWELVQNARDVSHEGSKAHIRFLLKQDEFVFEHDGQPFTEDALNGLILQTSNKVRQDIVKVGQYGTGFLTTHLFGRQFVVEGSMLMVEGLPPYHNFDNLLIDRSADDTEVLKRALQEQSDEVVSWSDEKQERSENPQQWTRFRYLQKVPQESENVRVAFREAPALVPYVLVLNSKYIERIEFVNEIERIDEHFELLSEEQDERRYGDAIRTAYTIRHERTGAEPEVIVLWALTSYSEHEEKTGESKATVIMPVKRMSEQLIGVYELDSKMPRQFLYFPLLGTCDWEWNYVVHSPLFTCDTDSRDKLLLLGDGYDANNSKAAQNKEVLQLAGRLIMDYLDNSQNGELNPQYWARVSFPMLDDKIRPYFEGLQHEWVDYFKEKYIVRHGVNWLRPMDIHVLDRELCLACEENDRLLHAIYTFLMHQYGDKTTDLNVLLYWSRITEEWYKNEETNPLTLGIKDIASQIESIDLTAEDLDWLLPIAEFLNKHHPSLLDDKAILPNEKLQRFVRDDLERPIAFDRDFRIIMNELIPDEVKRFIHPQFSDIIKRTPYGFKEAEEKLSAYIKGLPKEYDHLKQTLVQVYSWRNTSEKAVLAENKRWAILSLYKMCTLSSATGVYKQVYDLLEEYYGACPITKVKLDTEIFDNRICYTALIHDALLQFGLLDKDQQVAHSDWMLRMIKALYSTSDTQAPLKLYPVYPNQLGEFTYGSVLLKESGFFTEKLKDYYNLLCEPDKDIRKILLAEDYAECFVETGTKEAQSLATDIQAPFVVNGNFNIKNNANQSILLEIIQHLEDPRWQLLFSDFNSHKPDMMMSIMEGEKKESLFRLMSIKETNKLQKIAALADEKDLDRILQLGRSALQQEKRDEMDWEHKKKLGYFVERSLLHRLNEVLGGHSISVPEPTKDIQGGQDLVVFVDGDPIYYIEVKSRWETDRSVLMSSTQHKTSVERMNHYALCAADMNGFEQKYAFEHDVAEDEVMADLLSRIKVLPNIGKLNEHLSSAVNEKDATKTHIAGGYQVLVSQEVLGHGVSFDRLIEVIEEIIKQKLGVL